MTGFLTTWGHWIYSGSAAFVFLWWWHRRHRRAKKVLESVESKEDIKVVFKGGRIMISMLTKQTCSLILKPVLADGVTPGTVDSPPTWAVDQPDVTLAPSPDGLTCVVVSTVAGVCNVTPTVLAGGVNLNAAAFAITVTARPQPATQVLESSTPPVDV
jgi:hypothetical protein